MAQPNRRSPGDRRSLDVPPTNPRSYDPVPLLPRLLALYNDLGSMDALAGRYNCGYDAIRYFNFGWFDQDESWRLIPSIANGMSSDGSRLLRSTSSPSTRRAHGAGLPNHCPTFQPTPDISTDANPTATRALTIGSGSIARRTSRRAGPTSCPMPARKSETLGSGHDGEMIRNGERRLTRAQGCGTSYSVQGSQRRRSTCATEASAISVASRYSAQRPNQITSFR